MFVCFGCRGGYFQNNTFCFIRVALMRGADAARLSVYKRRGEMPTSSARPWVGRSRGFLLKCSSNPINNGFGEMALRNFSFQLLFLLYLSRYLLYLTSFAGFLLIPWTGAKRNKRAAITLTYAYSPGRRRPSHCRTDHSARRNGGSTCEEKHSEFGCRHILYVETFSCFVIT